MSETDRCRANSLKEYELFFDSVSLKLYTYAYFATGDKKAAEKIVELSFLKGYKEAVSSSFDEGKITKLMTAELIKGCCERKLLARCAVYLYLKGNFSVEEISGILSLKKDEVRSLIVSMGKMAEPSKRA